MPRLAAWDRNGEKSENQTDFLKSPSIDLKRRAAPQKNSLNNPYLGLKQYWWSFLIKT